MTVRLHAVVVFTFMMLAALTSGASAGDALDAMRASFRISDGRTSGTCFVVRGKEGAMLVTAAHVMNDMKRDVCKLVLRKKKEDGQYERLETPIRVRMDGRPLWRQHATADLAVMKFAFPAGIDIQPFELEQISSQEQIKAERVSLGDICFIPCFPAKIEADTVGWPVLRRGSVASYPPSSNATASTFLINYSNFGGDSGAVVVTRPAGSDKNAKQSVIGIVVGHHRITDRTVTAFEERQTHHPINLAICVHAHLLHELLPQ